MASDPRPASPTPEQPAQELSDEEMRAWGSYWELLARMPPAGLADAAHRLFLEVDRRRRASVSNGSLVGHMVSRFLGWRLPEDFRPDAGISFKATFNEHTAWPGKHEPVGTNLLDATQAEAMVRYMIDGMPALAPPAQTQQGADPGPAVFWVDPGDGTVLVLRVSTYLHTYRWAMQRAQALMLADALRASFPSDAQTQQGLSEAERPQPTDVLFRVLVCGKDRRASLIELLGFAVEGLRKGYLHCYREASSGAGVYAFHFDESKQPLYPGTTDGDFLLAPQSRVVSAWASPPLNLEKPPLPASAREQEQAVDASAEPASFALEPASPEGALREALEHLRAMVDLADYHVCIIEQLAEETGLSTEEAQERGERADAARRAYELAETFLTADLAGQPAREKGQEKIDG